MLAAGVQIGRKAVQQLDQLPMLRIDLRMAGIEPGVPFDERRILGGGRGHCVQCGTDVGLLC
jgi:hypothetical protein